MKRFVFILAIIALVLSSTMAEATVIRGVGGAARFRGRFVIRGGSALFVPAVQQQVIVQQQPLLIQQPMVLQTQFVQPQLVQSQFSQFESFGAFGATPFVADPFLGAGIGGFGFNGLGVGIGGFGFRGAGGGFGGFRGGFVGGRGGFGGVRVGHH